MKNIPTPFRGRMLAVAAVSTLALLALSACDRGQTPQPVTQPSPLPAPATLTQRLDGTLGGGNMVPPVDTTASGSVEGSWVPDSRTLSWTVTYSGLSGPVTGAHFHGPAAAGENAGVVLPFTGSLESPIQGSATLSPEQAQDLVGGRWYVNLHTAAHPDGEIRGQVSVSPN